nr:MULTISPECIES: hypothetical protein [unclassified Pseudomonas]
MQTPICELPENQTLPDGRLLLLFKGQTMREALEQAACASIENIDAWSCRACVCGEWTIGYEVRA